MKKTSRHQHKKIRKSSRKKYRLRSAKNRKNKEPDKAGIKNNHNAKDVSEKNLFSYNDIFADIVNGCYFNGEQVIHPDELADAGTFTHYKTEGTVHGQYRDAAKLWEKGKIIFALIGLENQTEEDKEMLFRTLSHDAAAYKFQSDNKLKKRYPVISIVLSFSSRKWKSSCLLSEHLGMDDDNRLLPLFNEYRMNLVEVSFLTENQIANFKSDFRTVAEMFVKIRTGKKLEIANDYITHVEEILDLMKAVSESAYQNLVDQMKDESKGKGGTHMSHAINNYLRKAENKGRKLGEKDGRKAQQQKTAASLINDGLPDEFIMKHTSLSKKDVEEERRKLQMK